MNNKYIKEINTLSEQISVKNDWELYYQRGYLYFLINEDKKAKEDYHQAVSLGLDFTEVPVTVNFPSGGISSSQAIAFVC